MAEAHRTERITVRLQPAERAVIEQRAAECGMAPSTFLRTAGLGAVPRPRPGAVERQAVHQLARIGNNLNQLARHANAAGRLRLAERIAQALTEIEAVLRGLT